MKLALMAAIFVLVILSTPAWFLLTKPITEVWNEMMIRESNSSLENDNTDLRSSERTFFDKDDDLIKVVFRDSTSGLAITFNKIYKTSNGGNSWEVWGSIPGRGLKDIALLGDREAVALTYKLGERYGGEVMMTGDGAITWNTVFSSETGNLEKMYFDSYGNGAVVGRKKTFAQGGHLTGVVILTNDFGRTWTDASGALNSISKSGGEQSASLTNAKVSKGGSIIVLSSTGRLYRSADEGKSWKEVAGSSEERPQTDIRHFGEINDQKFWIAGGTISREGTWGVVASTTLVGWNKYRLDGYYFSDVTFLSDDKVLACGSTEANLSPGERNRVKRGVVLSSQNGGRTWSVVHESQLSSEFTSIAKISEAKLFVVGDGGSGVLLEESTGSSPATQN